MVSETVNNEILKRVTSTSLEMGHNSQEQDSRRECLKTVGIPSSLDEKNLQSTVYSILGEIDLVCQPNDIENCHRNRKERAIIKFSSRRKSSEVLNKKKKLKHLDIRKHVVNDESRIYINESLHPYYGGLLENVKFFGKTRLQLPLT